MKGECMAAETKDVELIIDIDQVRKLSEDHQFNTIFTAQIIVSLYVLSEFYHLKQKEDADIDFEDYFIGPEWIDGFIAIVTEQCEYKFSSDDMNTTLNGVDDQGDQLEIECITIELAAHELSKCIYQHDAILDLWMYLTSLLQKSVQCIAAIIKKHDQQIEKMTGHSAFGWTELTDTIYEAPFDHENDLKSLFRISRMLTNVGEVIDEPAIIEAVNNKKWQCPDGYVSVDDIMLDPKYKKNGKNPPRTTIQKWEQKSIRNGDPVNCIKAPDSQTKHYPEFWVMVQVQLWHPRNTPA